MAYIDKKYYDNDYVGKEIPGYDFDNLADKASMIIDFITYGRASKYTSEKFISMIKLATAIQTEYMYCQGGIDSYTGKSDNLKTSENIGNYAYSQNIDRVFSFGGIPISPLAVAVLDSLGIRYAGI